MPQSGTSTVLSVHSQTWHNYVKKKCKTKDGVCCCSSARQAGGDESASSRPCPSDRTASITRSALQFLCHFLPAHHNIITFHFSSQGPLFSPIQDNSWTAQPGCLLKMLKRLLFVSVLATPILTLLLDKFSCCQKMHSALKLSWGWAKELPGCLVLVCTVIYPWAKLFW